MVDVEGLDDETRISMIYSLDTRIAKETRRCIQNIEDIVIGLSDTERTVLSEYYLSQETTRSIIEMRKEIWFHLLDAHERIENKIRVRITESNIAEEPSYPSVGDLMNDAEEVA